MSVARKKVIVRMWAGDYLPGYAAPPTVPGLIAFLALDGRVVSTEAKDVKWVCYVREFTGGDLDHPERLLQKTFLRRPRSPGIWCRIRLQDNDLIEGLAQNDLSLLDASGLSLLPPDIRSNTQRMMIPRPSIRELEILAVIRKNTPRQPSAPPLPELFK